eukprot:Hpha_TRINITY_DN23126_c0_g1::TRINITY_DN23126_c0_g1_i1::g.29541::m.29541
MRGLTVRRLAAVGAKTALRRADRLYPGIPRQVPDSLDPGSHPVPHPSRLPLSRNGPSTTTATSAESPATDLPAQSDAPTRAPEPPKGKEGASHPANYERLIHALHAGTTTSESASPAAGGSTGGDLAAGGTTTDAAAARSQVVKEEQMAAQNFTAAVGVAGGQQPERERGQERDKRYALVTDQLEKLLSEDNVSVGDLNELCIALAHTGFTAEAYAVVELMWKRKTHGVSSGALNATVSRLMADATKNLRIKYHKHRQPARAVARSTCGWEGPRHQVGAACQLIDWMGQWGLHPSPHVLAVVMRYLALLGESRECMKVLSLMEQAGHKMRGQDYGALQSALCARRRYSAVRELHKRLLAAEVPLCGQNVRFAALASRSVLDAMEVVSEASAEHKVYAFTGVFEACQRLGTSCDEVLSVYRRMSGAGITPSSPRAEVVYTALISCFCAAAVSTDSREWHFAKAAVEDAPVETGEWSFIFLKHCARLGDAESARSVQESVQKRLSLVAPAMRQWKDETDTLLRGAQINSLEIG